MNEIVRLLAKLNVNEEYINNKILINFIKEILKNENIISIKKAYDYLKDVLVISENRIGIVSYKTSRFDMDGPYYAKYIHKKNDKRYLYNDRDDLIRKIIYLPGIHIITSDMIIFKSNNIVEREIFERKYTRSIDGRHINYDFDLNREVYKDNYMIKEEQYKDDKVIKQDILYGSITSNYYYEKMKKPDSNNYREKTILESINPIKALFTYDSNYPIDPIYHEESFKEISFEIDIDYDLNDSIYKFSDNVHNNIIEMRKDNFRKQRQKIKKL